MSRRLADWPARALLLALLPGLLLACGGGDDEAETPARLDPEAAARVFFEQHALARAADQAPYFVREVNPGSFPLRHMVKEPADYRFADFWRVRTVDNRYVVEALIELKGRPHAFTVWLEMQDEAWKLAGWNPDAVPVDPAQTAPPAGARVPLPFAPAAFRGAPPATVVKVEPPWSDIAILDREIPMEALPRVIDASDQCPRRLERAIDAQSKSFVQCYAAAFEEGPYRRGRMAFDVTAVGDPANIGATLAETTLLHPSLGNCVASVLRFAELPPVRKGICEARVGVTFSPVDPAELEARRKKKEAARKKEEARRKKEDARAKRRTRR